MPDSTDTHSNDDQPFDLEREPLDQRPYFEAHDWGGDGSDLSRPVRAHVLAALVPTSEPYSPPVSELIGLGDARQPEVAVRRQTLTFRQEHVPQLVRMARDRALNTANSDTAEVWAPSHAIAVLADLDISDVVSELIPLLDIQDDWNDQLLPELFGDTGAAALEPLRRYLVDPTRWAFGRARAAEALEEIAKRHPELRDQVVAILSEALQHADQNHEAANTFVIDALVNLDAVEALPLIRQAFESGRVDEMVRGDWSAVQIDLGVEPAPDDPLVRESAQRWEEKRDRLVPRDLRQKLRGLFDQTDPAPPEAAPMAPPAPAPRAALTPLPPAVHSSPAAKRAQKEKNKRKTASAARKANRGKKKRR